MVLNGHDFNIDQIIVIMIFGRSFMLLLLFYIVSFQRMHDSVYLWSAVYCSACFIFHLSISEGKKKTSLLFFPIRFPWRCLQSDVIVMLKLPMRYLLV